MKKMLGFIKQALVLSVLFQSMHALSVENDTSDAISAIKNNISKSLPQYQIKSIEAHEKSGMYTVQLDSGPVLHATPNGQYFIVGDLYRVEPEGLVNETEEAKLAQIEVLPHDEMVIYPAKGEEKAHVTVFTDISCGYCRMLHKEVPELNEMGISIRYLAFPRAGIGSEPYQQMVSVWCSDDPKEWLTRAKSGQKVPQNNCENPIAKQYGLGQSIGVRGTPSLVLSTGEFIPGYLPAAELAAKLGL